MLSLSTSFWQKKISFLSFILLPLSWVYYALSCCCFFWRKRHAYSSSLPVICIGNVTLGGAGKTPVAIALCEMLQEAGYRVAFLSRGYKGSLTGPIIVSPSTHSCLEAGDEALLLSQHATTIVAKKRKEGAQYIEHHVQADVIIMDDGLQNASVTKDLSFLVIDKQFGIGNGRIFPAGPLREPLAAALKKTHAIIEMGNATLPGAGAAGECRSTFKRAPAITAPHPVFHASLTPDLVPALYEGPIIAFAGIGRPSKFFAMLKAAKVNLIEEVAFPDHYTYNQHDIMALTVRAQEKKANLATTEKDYMRLSDHDRKRLHMVPIAVTWENAALLRKTLLLTIQSKNKNHAKTHTLFS